MEWSFCFSQSIAIYLRKRIVKFVRRLLPALHLRVIPWHCQIVSVKIAYHQQGIFSNLQHQHRPGLIQYHRFVPRGGF